jgi:hypothetical protein
MKGSGSSRAIIAQTPSFVVEPAVEDALPGS